MASHITGGFVSGRAGRSADTTESGIVTLAVLTVVGDQSTRRSRAPGTGTRGVTVTSTSGSAGGSVPSRAAYGPRGAQGASSEAALHRRSAAAETGDLDTLRSGLPVTISFTFVFLGIGAVTTAAGNGATIVDCSSGAAGDGVGWSDSRAETVDGFADGFLTPHTGAGSAGLTGGTVSLLETRVTGEGA